MFACFNFWIFLLYVCCAFWVLLYSISVISGSFFFRFADTSSSFSSSLFLYPLRLHFVNFFVSFCISYGTYPNHETFNPYFYIDIFARFEVKKVNFDLFLIFV
jgi:hypothetical protein